MFNLLNSLKGYFTSSSSSSSYIIDNFIFKLHYKFTVGVLALFSILITWNQFFGDPIYCTKTGEKTLDDKLVRTFCWANGTFSNENAFDKIIGEEIIYPGIGKSNNNNNNNNNDIIYHNYYQWVCFVLAFQAIIFYLPRYIWKILENQKIKHLTIGLNFYSKKDNDDHHHHDGDEKIKNIIAYLKVYCGLHQNYFYKYILCEIINVFNVIIQIYFLNIFLGGKFLSYGTDVIQYLLFNNNNNNKTNPMIKLFPRMTKCQFLTNGPSGGFNIHNLFCILPLNIINEKIFLFLWFWLNILTFLTIINFLYRILIIIYPKLRIHLLKSQCLVSNICDIKNVTKILNIGDWFLIYLISKNIDPIYMRDILSNLLDNNYWINNNNYKETEL